MSKIRKLYEAHQELYANAGPEFTVEDRAIGRGELAYIPGKGTRGKHHIAGGCARVSADAATVVAPGSQFTGWNRFCETCTTELLRLNRLVPKLSAATSALLDAVTDAGGVCRETGQRFTTLSELFASERFPLPAADHPRDWYNFWVALNNWCSAVPTPGSHHLWGDYVMEITKQLAAAVERWTGDREVFTNLMHARARHAMLGPGPFKRSGEIGLRAQRRRIGAGAVFELSAPEDVSPRHIKNLNPTDYPTLAEYGAAVKEHLLRVALQELHEIVDSELDAAWEGEDTLLAWNHNARGTKFQQRHSPLLGWFFPAVAIPEGTVATPPLVLGTVADAFATGGLDGFALIWETAETISGLPLVRGADLRAAMATLRRPTSA